MSLERYKMIKKDGHSSITEKKSVFIGDAVKISSEEEARAIIEARRKEYRDARHVAFAYTVGNITRFSDDGEPQGTAGAPVLDVIKKTGLANVLITVVRIFGGILLGAGGLVRMYSGAAAAAVEGAVCAFYEEYTEYSLPIVYNEYSKLMYEIDAFGGRVTDSDFSENVVIRFTVPSRRCEAAQKRITALTNGKRELAVVRRYFDEEKEK